MKKNVNELAKTFRRSDIIVDLRVAKDMAKEKLYTHSNGHLTNSPRYKRFVADCNRLLYARKSVKVKRMNSQNISKLRKYSQELRNQYFEGNYA